MRERHLRIRCFLIACTAIAAAAPAARAKDVPFLGGRVNDLAGLLRPDTESRLDGRLQQLEQSTGAQVVVLTIDSLEGDSLEEYAHRVATTWKLGQADADNGALLLVARDDRKMRIEVGYGLEATVPDVIAKRILDEKLRPQFRSGNFDRGITSGINALAGVIEGDPAALPARPARGAPSAPGRFVGLAVLGLPLGFFSLLALATKDRAGWLFWLFLAPFWFSVASAVLGWIAGGLILAAWLILFPIARTMLRRSATGTKVLDAIEVGLVTTASAGGWSSSGGWSSGSGGGGFSGGGGSFGGGGASSGW